MPTPSQRYRANLRRLKATNLPMARALNTVPMTNVVLQPNAAGQIVGHGWCVEQQAWVPLCEGADPWAEAQRDAEALYRRDARVFVLLGLGLGYFAVALAQRLRPYQRMAIFETSPSLYKAAMHTLDLTPLLSAPRVDTHIGEGLLEQMEHWYLALDTNDKFHMLPPLLSGFAQVYDKLLYEALSNKAIDMLRYHGVGIATWSQFGKHIGNNDFANLPELCTSPGLTALTDLWRGKPAVCIAAGPSLPKNVLQLADPRIRSQVAVITAGTMYAPLLHLGIVPDIVTTIDFQRLNWTDQFQHVPLSRDTALVYLHSTYPQTIRRWPGPTFVAMNSSDCTVWLLQFLEDKGSAAQVQTVAHLNLLTAYALGASPIFLLGQDLSMPVDMHHAPHARAQDTAPLDSLETHIDTRDYAGQPVWTRHSLLSMKTVFEQIFMAHPQYQVINCTEGGLPLFGAPNMPLSEALEAVLTSPAPLVALPVILREVYAHYVPAVKWEGLAEGLVTLMASLDGLQTMTQAWDAQYAMYAAALEHGRIAEATAFRTTLLADGQAFQAHPFLFSLFAARHFEVIRICADIPLPDGSTQDDLDTEQLRRFRTFADGVLTEGRVVQQTLRRLQKRLEDVAPFTGDQTPDRWLRRFAREQFQGDPAVPNVVPLMAQQAWHRQEYALAAALADWCARPALAKRARQRLATFHAQGHAIRQAYYQYPPSPPVPLSVVSEMLKSEVPLDPVLTEAPAGRNGVPPTLVP